MAIPYRVPDIIKDSGASFYRLLDFLDVSPETLANIFIREDFFNVELGAIENEMQRIKYEKNKSS